VADDPLMAHVADSGQIRLFNPAKPIQGQEPFLVLTESEVFSKPDEAKTFPEMRALACRAFLALEKAWQLEGGTLVDLKVEFGYDTKGRLLLADVIDNDSWRVLENGAYIDKQVYRDGGALDTVVEKYRRVADITSRFRVPVQRVILWRGSETDKTDAFMAALGELADLATVVTCSAHKEPVAATTTLHRMAQEVPDSVVIAYIGRSNGAGPTLSAMSTVPVITVPASIRDFPDDVWSSLRTPSSVPAMTVLEPANAVLAALQILSARNPRIYAHVRSEIEARTVNTLTMS
jgi:phosphoribosylaminoimidazole carboxylase PurE protein